MNRVGLFKVSQWRSFSSDSNFFPKNNRVHLLPLIFKLLPLLFKRSLLIFKLWELSSPTEANLFWPECVFFEQVYFYPCGSPSSQLESASLCFLKSKLGHILHTVACCSVPCSSVQSAAGASDKEWLMFLLLFPTIWHVSLTPAGMDLWQLCKGCSLGHNVQTYSMWVRQLWAPE